MRWRYTLIDRFNNQTVVDQPIGWDTFTIKIKRHPERHGTFRELQGNEFKFYGKAMELLRSEYEQFGIRGKYELLIEEKCGRYYEETYRGKVGFDNYHFLCDNGCYVTVDLDQIGPVVEFINRFDQKVDIDSNTAFDGVTPLVSYPYLSQRITLPSKAILLRGISTNKEVQEYQISKDSGWFPVASTGQMNGSINIPFSTTEVNGINDYKPQTLIDYFNQSNSNEEVPELIYNNPKQDLNCTGTLFQIDFRVKGVFKNLVIGSGNHNINLVLKKGFTDFYQNSNVIIKSWSIYSGGNNHIQIPFDITYSGAIELKQGEKLWDNFFLRYFKSTNYNADVRIQIDPETFFKASVISKCDPTAAKLYMINEATSRVIESITSGKLKLYSSYYGRRTSSPYAFPQNGCGALKALTTGLHIRNAKLADGTEPKLFLSMKDIFESLSAIDNIGVGVEGEDKIRLENWKFFYSNDIIFTCRNIEKLDKVAKAEEHFSTFKNGYEKWEAEDYNGLDEFLTKREWRTDLSEVQNELSKLSKMIASGYAIEVTRRKQNDTKDWRFDNDKFIICLREGVPQPVVFIPFLRSIQLLGDASSYAVGDQIQITGTALNNGTYTITGVSTIGPSLLLKVSGRTLRSETAQNAVVVNVNKSVYGVEVKSIDNAAHIVDPDSVYNFRISPARNAMRWFDRIAACYRHTSPADLLHFTSGDGNFVAEGTLRYPDCKIEAGVLKENTAISLLSYEEPADGLPIHFPERVKYTYPMTSVEHARLKAAPNGLIAYESKCEKGQGWIDEAVFHPEEGKINFTLIPKILSNG